jgi:predicted tellurium resistance membrane protein TerC
MSFILAIAIAAAAVVLVTFVFTTLIHEPASIITLLGVFVLSIALDFGWKRVRDSRASGGTTSDVQAGH